MSSMEIIKVDWSNIDFPDKKLNNMKLSASYPIMKHSFPLLLFAALGVFLLSSCVDPNYYHTGNTRTSYSTSATFTTLPHGYRTIYVSGTPYYYCGTRWYRRSGSHYVTCARPYGYYGTIGRSHHYHGLSRLPYGCRTTYVGGHRYYTHGNTWYRKSGSRYVTCSKPSSYHSDRHKAHHRSGKHKDQYKKSDHKKSHHKHDNKHTSDKSSSEKMSKKTFCKDIKVRESSRSDSISKSKPRSRPSLPILAKPKSEQTQPKTKLKNRISRLVAKEKD